MPHTLATPAHSELIIRKSRFIGCVQPVVDRTQAQAIVAQLRLEHPGAVHVCWALQAGGHSAAVDDGEPSGTAGRPMLEVLRHHDLEGVLATVVRYFGGIKLGAGGLVRAYTDTVAQALLKAQKIVRVPHTHLSCEVPYALEGWLRRELDKAQAQEIQITHTDCVCAHWSIAQTAAPELIVRLNEGGQGRLVWSQKSST